MLISFTPRFSAVIYAERNKWKPFKRFLGERPLVTALKRGENETIP